MPEVKVVHVANQSAGPGRSCPRLRTMGIEQGRAEQGIKVRGSGGASAIGAEEGSYVVGDGPNSSAGMLRWAARHTTASFPFNSAAQEVGRSTGT